MNEPYYKTFQDALKPKDQCERLFYIDQLERCYEALREACKLATRDKDGKPIFYYAHKGNGDRDGTQLISLRYVSAETGEFHNLNYIAAVNTKGLRLLDPNEGVIADGTIFKSGAEIVSALSVKSDLLKKSRHLIKAVEI